MRLLAKQKWKRNRPSCENGALRRVIDAASSHPTRHSILLLRGVELIMIYKPKISHFRTSVEDNVAEWLRRWIANPFP